MATATDDVSLVPHSISLDCSESLDEEEYHYSEHLESRDEEMTENQYQYDQHQFYSSEQNQSPFYLTCSPVTRSPSPGISDYGTNDCTQNKVLMHNKQELSLLDNKWSSDQPWPFSNDLSNPMLLSGLQMMQVFQSREELYLPMKGYLESMQPQLTPSIREEIVAWVSDLANDVGLSDNIVAIAINLFDRFLSIKSIRLELVKILITTCLSLAVKVSDDSASHLAELVHRAEVSLEEMQIMERIVLSKLDWYVNVVTPHEVVVEMSGQRIKSPREVALCDALLFNSLLEYSLVGFRPTVVATACALLSILLEAGPCDGHEFDERINVAAKMTGLDFVELRLCVNILQTSLEKTFDQM
eukprot:Plantae.Rhodophyta-Hildenbrandia_rubra.ctg4560.p1 GENE.Plantae.Rhodophyta-Hildenbrandia_rubra.ctg4560~~Plantae.Rhodophyta-Hildenbrandia_rubra.ctg4560.p1  ORF type:complete len:357 (-),score=57.49 Plantae.Rhodophyta-Hildenbrandia_rubra.ctg4560:233-1303(-)